jgi:nitrite reductase/ring-hydroxylating ferredoxin subunit
MNETPNDLIVRKGEVICHPNNLANHSAIRFQVRCSDIQSFPGMNADPEDYLPAFVLRKNQLVVAYLNRCAHLPMEMDWNPAQFLDEDLNYIVCATHYAVYEIKTGLSVRGPCPKGASLIPLAIQITENEIIFTGSESE